MNETSDIDTATPETTVASAEPLSGMRLLPGETLQTKSSCAWQ
jgi:hypothetical protein